MDSIVFSTKQSNWRTPPWLFNLLDREFGFNLDAAADDTNALCPRYFTEHDNALRQAWWGNVYCNPPYGRDVGAWVRKGYNETVLPGHAVYVVMLLAARTDTIWWHDYVLPYADSLYFIRGRLKFSEEKQAAPFPSCVVVFYRFAKYNALELGVITQDGEMGIL